VSTVKGSPQYRLKVVKYRPLLVWSLRMAMLLVVTIAIGASYRYGMLVGGEKAAAAEREILRLQEAVRTSQATESEVRQQLANLQLGAQVDRRASEDVRQEVLDLKNQLAELQEENSFYRNLMAPSENKDGLNFGAVEIIDTDNPRQYRYKVVLQQLATNHQLLNGSLTFNVVGRQDGAEKVLPLRALSDEIDTENIKLRFKYFQTVQGQLRLPEGFEPERIELTARSSGSNAVKIEKRFGWLVQET
jgi:hypothetical protein